MADDHAFKSWMPARMEHMDYLGLALDSKVE